MKVTIAGAGITGLTTALVLQKVGVDFQVFEKAKVLRPVGAGIWMAPNAMKIFKWLGIADEVKSKGMSLREAAITTKKFKPLRKSIRESIQGAEGDELIAIHRGKLQEVLLGHLDQQNLSMDNEYLGHEEEGEQVRSYFSNAESTAHALLGADGLHSAVRSTVFPNSNLRYSGQTCWRGVANIQLGDSLTQGGMEAWGKRKRFGLSVIGENQVYWFAVKSAPAGTIDEDPTKPMLQKLFGDFHPLVSKIIEDTPSTAIIKNDLHDLDPLDTWHKGRTCLMGDAAHAATPNMGQGGAQGIEDAYVLGNLLKSTGNPHIAFQKFEKLRRPKVDMIVKNSWQMGKMAHNPVLQTFMKLAVKLTPANIIAKQMQQVYEVPKPEEVTSF